MRYFLKNYSLKQHIGIVAALYAVIDLVGNLLLFRRHLNKAEKEMKKKKGSWIESIGKKEMAKAVAVSYVKKPSTAVKAFNCCVCAGVLVDLCAYPLIKSAAEKVADQI